MEQQIQILLSRAKANRDQGNQSEATLNVKKALSLDSSHLASQQLLQELICSPLLNYDEFIHIMSLPKHEKHPFIPKLSECVSIINDRTVSEFIKILSNEQETECKDPLYSCLLQFVKQSKINVLDKIQNWDLFLQHPIAFDIVYECISQKNSQTQPCEMLPAWISIIDASNHKCQVNALQVLVKSVSCLSMSDPLLFLKLLNHSNHEIVSLAVIGLQSILQDEEYEQQVKEKLESIVTNWIESPDIKEKMMGYKGLQVLLQLSSSIGNKIFQRESTISSILYILNSGKEEWIILVLQLVSNACIDVKNRSLISSLSVYIQPLLNHTSLSIQSLGAVILTKLSLQDSEKVDSQNQKLFLTTCLNSLYSSSSSSDQSLESYKHSVEAIALLSRKSFIKQILVKDAIFLKKLSGIVSDKNSDKSILYGVAIIYVNLSSYKRKLSPEQEQLQKLKEFSKGNKKDQVVVEEDPLEKDEIVSQRNALLIKHQIVSTLLILAKDHPSENMLKALSIVLLNLAHEKPFRGILIQQGAVKILLGICRQQFVNNAAQALAKLLITSDPNIVFKGNSVLESIGPLVKLLQGDDGLCQFEGLLALTNLSSMQDEAIRSHIIQLQGIPLVESLVFSDNVLIRRASTELMCNMMYSKEVFERYSQPGSSQRLKLFIALADSEDFGTQRAASGVLAILSSSKEGCISMMKQDRFIFVLKSLLQPDNMEILHRGLEICKNVFEIDSSIKSKILDDSIVKSLNVIAQQESLPLAELIRFILE